MLGVIVGTVFMIALPNVSADNALQKNPNNFGPYSCTWSEYGLCQGPKSKNLTVATTEVVKQGEEFVGYVNFTFLAQSTFDEIKILVYVLKGNVKNLLWSYNLKDPCQHFVFASVIESNLNAHNCVVSKGDYNCAVNFSELMKSFLGPSFFYGQYLMKATVLSKKGNILCISTKINVLKIVKEKQ